MAGFRSAGPHGSSTNDEALDDDGTLPLASPASSAPLGRRRRGRTPAPRALSGVGNHPVLRFGSRGEAVAGLQRLLNVVLQLKPPLALGRLLDVKTHDALVRFQKAHGLHDYGVADAPTWHMLEDYEYLRKKRGTRKGGKRSVEPPPPPPKPKPKPSDKTRKLVKLQWDRDETWCTEDGPISGTTVNYSDGESISILVDGKEDGGTVRTLKANVSGNAFSNPWKQIVNVLPIGGPKWKDKRPLDGTAEGVKTPKPLLMRFIPNVKRGTKKHNCLYDRTEPGKAKIQVAVACRFELEVQDYLLKIIGKLKYVRGWGRERLLLNDSALTGGFTMRGATNHWGYQDVDTGKFKYWDGSAWQDPPAAWKPRNSNHFGIPFYKSGGKWVCRDDPKLAWPEKLPDDWPADKFSGKDNLTDKTLAQWKKNIDTRWTDKFDIKRKECKSTDVKCCRYKTACTVTFESTDAYADGVIIVVYENVRSDSGMWAFGDEREGLAPHEFGHLLGAPDEYDGVGTRQYGVTDDDGLKDGLDDNCLMGVNLLEPKRRHYKGVCEMMALLVKDQVGKTYTYEAVAKAATLAPAEGSAKK